ncbi:aliphatic sulfonate ABC transporter substrate-binding protein [Alicyclobacillus acidiphilus]|uniref:aliphatic sulfonate ABC transporter substrate-binding protein n=1 Tax=Alicyclobacillus acidiphilus TaxID=182455 RepID=UPI000836A333|nr:aliphatic sulfonate ABC transporter substrate-binding protein [Alicyclobacillus acidiphilus]
MKNLLTKAAVTTGLLALQASFVLGTGTVQAATENDHVTVNIGYQESAGPFLLALKKGWFTSAFAKLGAKINWYTFQSGPAFFTAIASNHLDFGGVGNTPVVVGQASNVQFKEIAVTGLGSNSEGLLVPANSPIHSMADLKGKKIAVAPGSSAYNFLYQALNKAKLQPSQVTIEQLQPNEAESAFDSHKIDAWAIWDPYLSTEVVQHKAKVLEGVADLNLKNTEFSIARTAFIQQHPKLTETYLQVLEKATAWQKAHPSQAIALYSQILNVPKSVIAHDLVDAPPVVQPVTNDIIQQQQSIANFLYSQHVITTKVDVSKVVDNTFVNATLKNNSKSK